jgi:hypothetical protein
MSLGVSATTVPRVRGTIGGVPRVRGTTGAVPYG